MEKQRGVSSLVILICIIIILLCSYFVYDASNTFLGSKVSLDLGSELTEYSLIANDNSKTDQIVTQIATLSGVKLNTQKSIISFNTDSEDEDISINSNTSISFVTEPSLSKSSLGTTSIDYKSSHIRSKKISNVNLILVVSDSVNNKELVTNFKTPLKDAISYVLDNVSSTISIIPYSYRLNIKGRCYTESKRSDGFSFIWWDSYFTQESIRNDLFNELENLKNSLSQVESDINKNKEIISSKTEEMNQEEDPELKDEIQKEIDNAQENLDSLYDKKDTLTDEISDVTEDYEKAQEELDNLKNTDTYDKYNLLGYHYSNSSGNYEFIDNFYDPFLIANNYNYTSNDALDSVSNSTLPIDNYYQLSIDKNNTYFGNSNTCPQAEVSLSQQSLNDYDHIMSSLEFKAQDVSPFQGFSAALKLAFNGNEKRTIVIYMVDNKEEYISEQDLPSNSESNFKYISTKSCQLIKSMYKNNIAAKNIFLARSKETYDKNFIFGCDVDNMFNDQNSGIVFYEDSDNKADLSSRIIYKLLQESSQISS